MSAESIGDRDGGATIGVVIVDDDPLVRAGLRLMLGGEPDIVILGEAADGRAGVALVRSAQPDVVLMDIRMPVLDGIAATGELLAQSADDAPKVIVLTTFDADDDVLRALACGAHGFLLKDTPPGRIVDAIRAVAAGEPMLSPSVTAQLIRRATGDYRAPGGPADGQHATGRARQLLAGLTERERDVAIAVGRGGSNADIGAALFMSVPTVKAHVSRVLAKLGAQNRVQVALIVRDARLPDV